MRERERGRHTAASQSLNRVLDLCPLTWPYCWTYGPLTWPCCPLCAAWLADSNPLPKAATCQEASAADPPPANPEGVFDPIRCHTQPLPMGSVCPAEGASPGTPRAGCSVSVQCMPCGAAAQGTGLKGQGAGDRGCGGTDPVRCLGSLCLRFCAASVASIEKVTGLLGGLFWSAIAFVPALLWSGLERSKAGRRQSWNRLLFLQVPVRRSIIGVTHSSSRACPPFFLQSDIAESMRELLTTPKS